MTVEQAVRILSRWTRRCRGKLGRTRRAITNGLQESQITRYWWHTIVCPLNCEKWFSHDWLSYVRHVVERHSVVAGMNDAVKKAMEVLAVDLDSANVFGTLKEPPLPF